MSELFDRTNQAFAKIVASFEEAKINQQKIASQLTEVETARVTLVAKGLLFEPYEPRLAQLQQEQKSCSALMDCDPMTAANYFQSLENTGQCNYMPTSIWRCHCLNN